MDVVSCMFNVAIKDWGYRMDNPHKYIIDKWRATLSLNT